MWNCHENQHRIYEVEILWERTGHSDRNKKVLKFKRFVCQWQQKNTRTTAIELSFCLICKNFLLTEKENDFTTQLSKSQRYISNCKINASDNLVFVFVSKCQNCGKHALPCCGGNTLQLTVLSAEIHENILFIGSFSVTNICCISFVASRPETQSCFALLHEWVIIRQFMANLSLFLFNKCLSKIFGKWS